MKQQWLNNATTTTQQMQQQHNYACGTNRATTPFANVVIWLDRLQPPMLKKQQSYYNAHFVYLLILLEKIIYLYDIHDLCDACDFRDFNEELWLILLFNKIRFENKINIKLWGCLVIFKSFGEIE